MFDLVNSYPELNITIKAQELRDMVEYLIKRTHQELEQKITEDKTDTFLSRNEVAKMLSVDKSTLWRWNKQGYLVAIEIGGKRRYRMRDVKQILEKGRQGSN